MIGVPWFLARFLTRFLARFLTRVFGQGFLGQKMQCTVLLGRRNTVLQYYRNRKIQFYSWDGENLRKNHVIKIPISLKIPCIKSLAVVLLVCLFVCFCCSLVSVLFYCFFTCFPRSEGSEVYRKVREGVRIRLITVKNLRDLRCTLKLK